MRGLRVMVAVPTHDMCQAMFTYDLGQLMAFTSCNFVGPGQPIEAINLTFVTGTYVHSARQQIAELALEQNVDFILWLDSDMRFPKDTLVRLLKHREAIVGANYCKRGVPAEYVAVSDVDEAEYCVTSPESTGLEEVEAIGFGVVLMRTSVLKDLPDPGENTPWFWFDWNPKTQQAMGEDVLFCRALREVGHKVYVDHDLSQECGHIGTLEYKIEHAWDMHN